MDNVWNCVIGQLVSGGGNWKKQKKWRAKMKEKKKLWVKNGILESWNRKKEGHEEEEEQVNFENQNSSQAHEIENFVNESCRVDWKRKMGTRITRNGGKLRKIAEIDLLKFIASNSFIYGLCLHWAGEAHCSLITLKPPM